MSEVKETVPVTEFFNWLLFLQEEENKITRDELLTANLAFEVYRFRVAFVGLAPGERARGLKDFLFRTQEELDSLVEAEKQPPAPARQVVWEEPDPVEEDRPSPEVVAARTAASKKAWFGFLKLDAAGKPRPKR